MARKRVNPRLEAPMSSMIDVVFLLLIYFIVTIKIITPEAHVAINLPSTPPSDAPPPTPPQMLEIFIYPGEVQLRGRTISLAALGEYLQETAAFSRRTTVMIKVSPEAQERALINVLDLCSKANLDQLNVMMLP
jgi:biopolymer transport protein ExbD